MDCSVSCFERRRASFTRIRCSPARMTRPPNATASMRCVQRPGSQRHEFPPLPAQNPETLKSRCRHLGHGRERAPSLRRTATPPVTRAQVACAEIANDILTNLVVASREARLRMVSPRWPPLDKVAFFFAFPEPVEHPRVRAIQVGCDMVGPTQLKRNVECQLRHEAGVPSQRKGTGPPDRGPWRQRKRGRIAGYGPRWRLPRRKRRTCEEGCSCRATSAGSPPVTLKIRAGRRTGRRWRSSWR